MLAQPSFADDFGHFVELKGVVSASSLFGVSGNGHDKNNDAARQRSPAPSSRQSRIRSGSADARASTEHRRAEHEHGSSPSGRGNPRRTGNRRRRAEAARIGVGRYTA